MRKTAIELYQFTLNTLPGDRPAAAASPTREDEHTAFIYQFLEQDRQYGSDEYPGSGTFSATTSPWLADSSTIPLSWSWTLADTEAQAKRTAEVNAENATIQEHVPKQHYSGSAVEQVHQRYTRGMWDPSVFTSTTIDTLTGHWIHDDAEFARQRLGGANPNVIARYTGSHDDLMKLINDAAGAQDKSALANTLGNALNNKQLFVCDYRPVLGNVIDKQFVRKDQHLAAPLAFFTIENNALMPKAIQIEAPQNGYIFTTADGDNAWLLAKLWVANADAQWWFSGSHLFNTHSIDMIFGIAALERIQTGALAESHPMVVLMYPHLKKVFDINTAVYNATAYDSDGGAPGIYQKGQFCDQFLPTGRIGIYQIINNLYQGYRFDDQAFDQTIQARGIDENVLPVHFPYRDDGGPWFSAITTFVGDIVDASYDSDAAVEKDSALNGWLNAVQQAFNHDRNERFTWQPKKARLKSVFANLMFLCTAQHTAVNDTMFDQYAFLPNGPFAMTAPPPKGGAIGDDDLLAALPDPQAKTNDNYAWPIMNQIDFVMNGTAPVYDAMAGNGPHDAGALHRIYPYDTGSAQSKAVEAFYTALWEGSDGNSSLMETIANNQADRAKNYRNDNSDAETVPNSVRYPYLSVPYVLGINAPVMNSIQI